MSDTVGSVNHRPRALLSCDAHKLLPRHQCAGVRSDGVEEHHHFVLPRGKIFVVSRRKRGDVRELGICMELPELAQVGAEGIYDLGVRERELEFDAEDRWTWLLSTRSEVASGVADREVCGRGCETVCGLRAAAGEGVAPTHRQ